MADQKSLQGITAEDKKRKCPECGSIDIGHEDGEFYCKKCGYVLE